MYKRIVDRFSKC